MNDIRELARRAARFAQLDYWKRDDNLDVTDHMADAVAVATLQELKRMAEGGWVGFSKITALLAAFTPAEPQTPEPETLPHPDDPKAEEKLYGVSSSARPDRQTEDKEDGAGLIHQVALDMAGTLPRPIWSAAHLQRLDAWARYCFGDSVQVDEAMELLVEEITVEAAK